MTHLRLLLPLLLLPFLAAPAGASYITVANQRIDRALYREHGPREVLAGRIEAVREREDGPGKGYGFHRDFDVRVEGVVLGTANRKGTLLRLTAAHFDWPSVLVPLEVGAKLILIVRPEEGEEGGDAQVLTVVPTARTVFEPVADRDAAKRVLADVLCRELRVETKPKRLRMLILLAGPVLEKGDAKYVAPFLEAKEAWLRRAALAVLAYQAGGPYLDLAVEDLRTFLRTIPHDAAIREPIVQVHEGNSAYAPYPLLFDHYFFLVTNWSEEEAQTVKRVLPLARVVANELKGAERQRWTHGVACLCRVGEPQDADLLWAYLQDLLENEKHEFHGDARARSSLIDGLSRMLDIENASYLAQDAPREGSPRTYVHGEPEQIERIRKAMADR